MFASVASMIDLFNMENIHIMQDLGYEVDVACNFETGSITSKERVNEFRKELESCGIKTYNIPVPRKISAFGEMAKSYRKIDALMQKNKYDIVHCHSPIGGVIARLACKKYRKQGAKVIYTAHGFHFYTGAPKLNWLLFYPIEKYCARYTDILITINKEDYSRAKNFRAKKVIYVPGIGIDVNAIQAIKVDREEVRAEFGVKPDDFLLFSAGQLSKRKNHEVILRALLKVRANNVKFLLCGLGELDEYLRNLAKELNVEDKIIFAGYKKEVKKFLHIADCFVFPSLQEGLPVALMEGMATGLPIICTEIRGNTDLIENGKGGYLLKTDDVDGFAQNIEKLSMDKELARSLGKNNFEVIFKFDTKVVKQYMNKIYLKAMEM